jgi:putative acetyltransferase
MAHEVTIARDSLATVIARKLVEALDAELLGRYPDEGDGFFNLVEDDVSEGRGAFFVAWRSGVAVGCGAIRTLDIHSVEVKRMYVTPEARGFGVGRAMLQALERETVALGRSRICLETGMRQPEAIALYRRHGYVEVPRFGDYPDSPLSLWLGKTLERESTLDASRNRT